MSPRFQEWKPSETLAFRSQPLVAVRRPRARRFPRVAWFTIGAAAAALCGHFLG